MSEINTHPVPDVLFGCAIQNCAEGVSYPPADLYWLEGSEAVPAGFYCDDCLSELADVIDYGMTLADELEERMGKAAYSQLTNGRKR